MYYIKCNDKIKEREYDKCANIIYTCQFRCRYLPANLLTSTWWASTGNVVETQLFVFTTLRFCRLSMPVATKRKNRGISKFSSAIIWAASRSSWFSLLEASEIAKRTARWNNQSNFNQETLQRFLGMGYYQQIYTCRCELLKSKTN